MTPGPLRLEAVDLRKRYGSRIAVDGVSFEIHAGEIVGLLGPNGAGKTTTLSMLSTIVRPDSGRVVIRRGASDDGRSPLGLVPQSLALYPTLTVAENVWHFARMMGLGRAAARTARMRVLDDVGLGDRAGDSMQSLSGGMKRRLNLACGIVHRPAVLLLDEPTVGVDLESREQILDLVRCARDDGTAVVYSTHTMEEAERICDRVLLIDRGRLVAAGSVEHLVRLAGNRSRMQVTCRGPVHADRLHALGGVLASESPASDGRLSLELASHSLVGDVLAELSRSGAKVLDFSLRDPNLADAFLALTGRSLRDSAEA